MEDATLSPSLQPFALEAVSYLMIFSNVGNISVYTLKKNTLLKPKIYILEWYRKAHWSLFRTEDVLEILLGPECRDVVLEQAVLVSV